jgi:hypothetical protein
VRGRTISQPAGLRPSIADKSESNRGDSDQSPNFLQIQPDPVRSVAKRADRNLSSQYGGNRDRSPIFGGIATDQTPDTNRDPKVRIVKDLKRHHVTQTKPSKESLDREGQTKTHETESASIVNLILMKLMRVSHTMQHMTIQ